MSQAKSEPRTQTGEPLRARGREVEVKFAGDPGILSRIFALRPLAGASLREPDFVQTTISTLRTMPSIASASFCVFERWLVASS
jgi:hypothetical protein